MKKNMIYLKNKKLRKKMEYIIYIKKLVISFIIKMKIIKKLISKLILKMKLKLYIMEKNMMK